MNWTVINGIKIDNEDTSALLLFNHRVWIDSDGYPVYGFMACTACAAPCCQHERVPVQGGYLHDWIWERAHPERPKRNGEIIHHKDHHPSNARRKNLAIGTRRVHALAHAAKKQKFSPREKQNLSGWRYRPHQPARVIDRPDIVALGMKEEPVAKREEPLSRQQHIRLLERRLEKLLPALTEEMQDRDSGTPIPRGASTSTWRSSETRRLGLHMPRLGCTEAEVALVLLLIKNDFSTDAVAESVSVNVGLLQEIRSRPSVDRALTNWRKYRRLPKARRLAYTQAAAPAGVEVGILTALPNILTNTGSPVVMAQDREAGGAHSSRLALPPSSSSRVDGLGRSHPGALSATDAQITLPAAARPINLSYSAALEVQTVFIQLEDEVKSIEGLPPAMFLDTLIPTKGSMLVQLLCRKLRHEAARRHANVTELLAASAKRLGRDVVTLSSAPRARLVR
jgi:HNH endonuclease